MLACDYCGEGDSRPRGRVHLYPDEGWLFHFMCRVRFLQDQRRPASREE